MCVSVGVMRGQVGGGGRAGWRGVGPRSPFGSPVQMAIRLLLSYSLARRDDAVFVSAVVLMCGLLRSSWHEAADSDTLCPASTGPKIDAELFEKFRRTDTVIRMIGDAIFKK